MLQNYSICTIDANDKINDNIDKFDQMIIGNFWIR